MGLQLIQSILLFMHFVRIHIVSHTQSFHTFSHIVKAGVSPSVWLFPLMHHHSFCFMSVFAVLSVTSLLLVLGLAMDRHLLVLPWKMCSEFSIMIFWMQQVLGGIILVAILHARVEMLLTVLLFTLFATFIWYSSYSRICKLYYLTRKTTSKMGSISTKNSGDGLVIHIDVPEDGKTDVKKAGVKIASRVLNV